MSVETAACLSRPARGRTQASVVSAARRPARRALARFGLDLGFRTLEPQAKYVRGWPRLAMYHTIYDTSVVRWIVDR